VIFHFLIGYISHYFSISVVKVSSHFNKPIEGIMMKKNIFLLITSIAVLSMSNGSIADDGKSLPGAACQPEHDEFDIARNFSGQAKNQSWLGQYWICPIVRDSMSPSMRRASMRIVNATGTMSCTLYSRSSSGGYISGPNRATNLSGGTVQTLNWGSVSDSNNGYYYFRCYVPAGSRIISYNWTERT
jgi:hypothetical protein